MKSADFNVCFMYNIGMKIRKARELGFCFGVRRAIRIIETEAGGGKKIVTLGPVVHNKNVVARLKNMGVEVVSSIDNLQNGIVAISSHGASPGIHQKIKSNGGTVIDTTCPTVRSAQKTARRLAREGYSIIIFGDADHPEVRGLLGWAEDRALASQDAGDIDLGKLENRIGIMAQTTQTQADFTGFVTHLMERLLPWAKEIRVVNTLCSETQKRQKAAEEIAGCSDLMIVVGGYNSANTRRLAEVCSRLVETYHIESSDEIKGDWLKGKNTVGITAGASTPDEAIEKVVDRIKSLAAFL